MLYTQGIYWDMFSFTLAFPNNEQKQQTETTNEETASTVGFINVFLLFLEI